MCRSLDLAEPTENSVAYKLLERVHLSLDKRCVCVWGGGRLTLAARTQHGRHVVEHKVQRPAVGPEALAAGRAGRRRLGR